jgi:hypothetical protein
MLPERTFDITLRPIRTLQIWHLSMLALVPLMFVIFRMVSEPYDASRALVENLVLIGGGILSGYTLLFFVITGKPDHALPSLFGLYRNSLSRVSFLIVSNILLTSVFLLLIHQLVFFRQVEFLSPTDVELYLGDDIGKPERLGFVRSLTPTYLRLPLGQHLLAVKDVATQQWIESQTLKVPSVITERGMLSIWINPRMKRYEELN